MRPCLTKKIVFGVASVAALAATFATATPSQAFSPNAQPSSVTAQSTSAASHDLYGWAVGTDGNLWDNVSVTATDVATGEVAASAITYGGKFDLWVPAGSYRVVYHDLSGRVPDLTYPAVVKVHTVGDAEVCLGHQQLTYGTVKNTGKPGIVGAVEVGAVLKASPGSWTPAATAYHYEWRVGSHIEGLGKTLKVYPGDLGRKVTLVVTADSPQWTSATAATSTVLVGKAHTKVVATGPSAVTPASKVTVTAHVTDVSVPTPRGTVTVYQGTKALASGKPRRGVATVAVPGLSKGKHTLSVKWSGTSYSLPSTDTVTLTVKKG